MQRKMGTQVSTAYDIILQRILSYEMAPESPISDNHLANELGMSRAPVREALLLLSMDGLVQTTASNKLIVAPIRLDDIEDILHVRNALETEAVRIIAENGWLDEEQKQNLIMLHEKFREAASLESVSEHYSYDDMFHSAIVDYAGSTRIIEILQQMRLQMQRARWLNLAVPSRQQFATQEHADLLEAILHEDLAKATECLSLHFKNSAVAFRNALEDERMKQLALTISNFFNHAT